MSAFEPSVRALLEQPRLAHVSTIGIDGAPQVSCVWIGLDGDQILFGTQAANAKVANIRRDPRTVISVEGDPGTGQLLQPYVVLRGTAAVESVEPSTWLALMDRLSVEYFGVPFPYRQGGDNGVIVRVDVERVTATSLG